MLEKYIYIADFNREVRELFLLILPSILVMSAFRCITRLSKKHFSAGTNTLAVESKQYRK